MKKIFIPITVLTLLISGSFVVLSSTCAHSLVSGTIIHVDENGFDPAVVKIEVGETVVFENVGFEDHQPASDNHPTHENYSEFDPRKPLPPDSTWEFTFVSTGEYTYHDHLFPEFGGIIKVTADSQPCQTFRSLFPANSETVGVKLSTLGKEVLTEFTPPVYDNYKVNSLINDIKKLCPMKDTKCIEGELKNVTANYGPIAALDLYTNLTIQDYIELEGDGHQVAHRIGRKSAADFGINFEAFSLCSTDYNYGCQHGFFEYALGRTNTPIEAIGLICNELETSGYSSKDRFYCYHGAGHGVMMAEAYDLKSALDTCDNLDQRYKQAGCWQGVFMENEVGAYEGEARKGVFNLDDILAPCNKVEDKYQGECYLNHSGWIVDHSESFKEATHLCLEADPQSINFCLLGLGLMVTNPGWQPKLLGEDKPKDFISDAWKLCSSFPEKYIDLCVRSGIDNIMSFDELNQTRTERFCEIVGPEYQRECFLQIGYNLSNITTSEEEKEEACMTLKAEGRSYCSSE